MLWVVRFGRLTTHTPWEDRGKSQTSIASPAEPGELLLVISEGDKTDVLWNLGHTALVFQAHCATKDFAVFVYLVKPGTTTQCYFGDSHPNGYSDLNFQWVSDTELKASYIHENGKSWVEQWLIASQSFACRPMVVNGQPTTKG